jgi:hypothetical protein
VCDHWAKAPKSFLSVRAPELGFPEAPGAMEMHTQILFGFATPVFSSPGHDLGMLFPTRCHPLVPQTLSLSYEPGHAVSL